MNRYQISRLQNRAEELEPQMIAVRRDLHAHPELAWCEFRTASLVAARLRRLGYEVITGPKATPEKFRMGVPGDEIMKAAYEEALKSGGIEDEMQVMAGGYTGVIGILHGSQSGDSKPVVALRVDMDALPVFEENRGQEYISVRPGRMHACGHDGHTAMGLAIAQILAETREDWEGTVKLFFQPAEEGVRGGKAMAESGYLDDVDHILGCHIFGREGRQEPDADVVPGARGSLATTKLNVTVHGQSAHAGSFPEKGHHAMLAAAAMIQNLYAIPRHSQGSSRINVGRVEAGTGRNVIADTAYLELEVRGCNSNVNSYMEDYARRVIQGAAMMHDCTCEIETVGSAASIESTEELSRLVQRTCRRMGTEPTTYLHEHSEGSEDCSYLLEKVKSHGGEAAFLILLNDTAGPGHSPSFDIEESVLKKGVLGISGVLLELLNLREDEAEPVDHNLRTADEQPETEEDEWEDTDWEEEEWDEDDRTRNTFPAEDDGEDYDTDELWEFDEEET